MYVKCVSYLHIFITLETVRYIRYLINFVLYSNEILAFRFRNFLFPAMQQLKNRCANVTCQPAIHLARISSTISKLMLISIMISYGLGYTFYAEIRKTVLFLANLIALIFILYILTPKKFFTLKAIIILYSTSEKKLTDRFQISWINKTVKHGWGAN